MGFVFLFSFLFVTVFGPLVLYLCYRWMVSRSKDEIFLVVAPSSTVLPFSRDPRHCGDELGDAFLQQKGHLAIYNADEIATQFGLRDVVLPDWLDLKLSREGLIFQQTWCIEVMGAGKKKKIFFFFFFFLRPFASIPSHHRLFVIRSSCNCRKLWVRTRSFYFGRNGEIGPRCGKAAVRNGKFYSFCD